MTVLGALAILEADVLECKKRNIDTSEMREALEFFEPVIRPQRLIPQYRNNLPYQMDRTHEWELEGQQQVCVLLSPVSVTRCAFCQKYAWTGSL
jgi:hypothetical protein